MSPPFVSQTSATVPMPSDSHARTVSIVSVCELPDEKVVQITPSAPSSRASRALPAAAACFWAAVSR